MLRLYIDPRLEKQLAVLRQAGKKAAIAAQKAEAIVSELKAGHKRPEQIGNPTKHGELRLKAGLKYDLGSGYRLVIFKQGRDLFVLHVGGHDVSHRWLENNRELPADDIRRRSECVVIPSAPSPNQTAEREGERPEKTEKTKREDSLETLDDQLLRNLFKGLIESVQNGAPAE
jgi:putative component of toxin-antitoxin plasmid stabilization module